MYVHKYVFRHMCMYIKILFINMFLITLILGPSSCSFGSEERNTTGILLSFESQVCLQFNEDYLTMS